MITYDNYDNNPFDILTICIDILSSIYVFKNGKISHIYAYKSFPKNESGLLRLYILRYESW